MLEIYERLAELRQQTDSLRLFALVDGAQYTSRRGIRLEEQGGRYPLFDRTPDAPLAHAGPWLIDAATAGDELVQDLAALELEVSAVTWIIALQSLDGLAQLLQLNLDMKLPDGRVALVRFWDPRVLVTLAEVLTPQQRYDFFGRIYEWHFLHQGRRVRIGRRHAYA